MRKLGLIPSDPIKTYFDKGFSEKKLKDYYNPLNFFDEVYILSPLETKQRCEIGTTIIPTKPRQLKRRIKELNLDVVRAYGGYWPCDMACNNKVLGVPVIVSVHDTNPKSVYDSIKKADVVFCMSKAVQTLVLTKYKMPNMAWLLPNRVDFDIMRPYEKNDFTDINEKYFYPHKILHVGRKEPVKNLSTLIKALKNLGNQYCLLAVGRGSEDEYVQLAENEGVSKRCFFLQSIKNEELARYYSWADCMCTPSLWEGFGVVFIEALASEAVVVTSDIAPMNEFIKNGINGLLVKDYTDPISLAKTIKLACEDVQLRAVLKKNARKSVEIFEKHKVDKLEVDYYAKVLSMPKPVESNMLVKERITAYKRRLMQIFRVPVNSNF